MLGQATGKGLKIMNEMTLVIIAKRFRQLSPFHLEIGFHITNNPAKPHNARIRFWMHAYLLQKMPFQGSFGGIG